MSAPFRISKHIFNYRVHTTVQMCLTPLLEHLEYFLLSTINNASKNTAIMKCIHCLGYSLEQITRSRIGRPKIVQK